MEEYQQPPQANHEENGQGQPAYSAPEQQPYPGGQGNPPPYGYPYQQPYVPPYYYPKSRLAAALLALTVGMFGVHNFYLGFNTKAIIQLVLTIVGLLGNVFTLFIPLLVSLIWSFVEGVQLISHSDQFRCDANGIALIE